MLALSKINVLTESKLNIEVRFLLTFIASLCGIILSNQIALAILLLGSIGYLLLDIKKINIKIVCFAYLMLVLMAFITILALKFLGIFMPKLLESSRALTIFAPFERLAIMINMVIPLVSLVSLSEIDHCLTKIKLPGLIRLPFLVMIRFIPTFFYDIKQLNEAIKIRFKGENILKLWLKKPFLCSRIFFMPLIVRLIRSGDELAMASELKGLNPKITIERETIFFKAKDYLIILIGLLIITSAFFIQYYSYFKNFIGAA